MRLRTFTASTISEAMRQVRTALGDDAVILSTEQNGKTVKITAAVEPAAGAAATAPIASHSRRRDNRTDGTASDDCAFTILAQVRAVDGALA